MQFEDETSPNLDRQKMTNRPEKGGDERAWTHGQRDSATLAIAD